MENLIDFPIILLVVCLWSIIGGFILIMFAIYDSIISSEIMNNFFWYYDPLIITVIGFICGPITLILPFILYAKYEYTRKKRIAEKERKIKRQLCGWWELKEFGGKY